MFLECAAQLPAVAADAPDQPSRRPVVQHYPGGKKRLETGSVGRTVCQLKCYLRSKNNAQLVVWWGDKPVNKMCILLVPLPIQTEEGDLLATSSHMRVLWGFQNLSAEPLNWNLREEAELTSRAVEIVDKQRC